MRAVVLVGGFGTRLQPLTLTTPKQLLPVAGPTMIERVLTPLAAHGVTEVVLSLGYRPDAFADHFPDGVCAGVQLHYAVEDEPLDTAGAIAFAARTAGIDETFLAVNGDVLTDLDITGVIAQHRRTGAEATVALTPVDDPSRYGVVVTHDDGRVRDFVEKPPAGEATSNWINAGTYVLEPSVLDRVPGQGRCSIEREVFPTLAAAGNLWAVRSEAWWVDAGTAEAFLRANFDIVDGRSTTQLVAREPATATIDGELGLPSLVGDAAYIETGASVLHSIIGGGARVESGARVEDAIIFPGAVVGPDAVVRRSIIGYDARVGRGAHLDELTVVGDAVDIGPDARLAGARVSSERG